MSAKSIYGDRVSGQLACNPQAVLVPSLITQSANLLANLNGQNKATTLAQMDNIRQQLMYIGGVGDSYKPYVSSADASRSLKVGADGKLEVVGALRPLQSTVQ
jgi:hypothetical protein